jgi:hypothetical protein
MATHPLKRRVVVRPLYSGAASRPRPKGVDYITRADAEVLARVLGFPGPDALLEFAEDQGRKVLERK